VRSRLARSRGNVGLRIKGPLALLYHLSFIVELVQGGFQLGTRAEVLGSIPLGDVFSATQIIPPSLARSPYGEALLSMNMARARGHDSHVVGGNVRLRIKKPFTPSISAGFYSWTSRRGSSNSYNGSCCSEEGVALFGNWNC
jgi:hypothetical protein